MATTMAMANTASMANTGMARSMGTDMGMGMGRNSFSSAKVVPLLYSRPNLVPVYYKNEIGRR